MPEHSHDLLQTFLDPLALVSRSGETVEANSAFRDLAERCGSPAGLAALFGQEAVALLAEALEHGRARRTLPVVVGPEPRPWFRVALSRDTSGERLAALLVDASEEAALRRRQLERDREIAVLRDIGMSLSGTLDLDTLAERIYGETARITQTANFYVALHDHEGQIVTFPRYVEEGAWREMRSRPFGNGLTEYILRTGKPLLLNRDVLERARALGIEPIGRPCRAWLGVPMVADGEPLGVMAIQEYDRSDCYDEHDLEILSVIAGQAAATIKHTRLLAASRRAYQELSEAQARLLESERVRGVTETVGTMNHEINNPLAAIVGNGQLLLRLEDALTPEVRAKVESILAAARRIQQVTLKMSTLIQASSMPYPSGGTILDVRRSTSEGEVCGLFPASPEWRGE